MRTWLLPEHISDALPNEALLVERLRGRLLTLFERHGYQLVIPPMLEYVESLLTGSGSDLDLRTFKLVDQLSGRLLGVRADITPQVARIDAHLMNLRGVNRLCYAGSVLHTLPAGLNRTREPLQVGAELYGDASIRSDLEVQRLMLAALHVCGIRRPQLDIGHVAVYRALVDRSGLTPEARPDVFRAVQAKDGPVLARLVRSCPSAVREALKLLPTLTGDTRILLEARRRLPGYPAIRAALEQLQELARSLKGTTAEVCFDLGELRGLHYHSGVVFAAYANASPNAIALGGRYDEVGKAFGRARPATGFSMDLRELAAVSPLKVKRAAILAPYRPNDAKLLDAIAALRRAGKIVIVDLPGHGDTRAELNCNLRLEQRAGKWAVSGARRDN